MQFNLGVGPQSSFSPGGPPASGMGDGTMRVGDAHGKYVEAVYRGNVWIGSNLGGTPVTTQAGLSATTPALTLFNPADSKVNLFLLNVGIGIAAAPAAACALFLAYNVPNLAGVPTAPVTTTTANVINAKLGSAGAPVGQCYRVSTLSAAPLLLAPLGGTTGAAAIGGVPLWFDLGGIVCISPGYAVSVQTSSAASLTGAFVWEELPIIFG